MLYVCRPRKAMPLLLSGKVFSIHFFRSSNLPSTTLDGSFTVLFVPIRNIILSGYFFNSGLRPYTSMLDAIVHLINCCYREVFNYDLSISF